MARYTPRSGASFAANPRPPSARGWSRHPVLSSSPEQKVTPDLPQRHIDAMLRPSFSAKGDFTDRWFAVTDVNPDVPVIAFRQARR